MLFFCQFTPFYFQTRKRMKPIVIVVLIVMAAASAQQQSSWEALETLDVDNVLKNTKLVKRYLDCLLDRGRCEKNGRDWKGNKTILLFKTSI